MLIPEIEAQDIAYQHHQQQHGSLGKALFSYFCQDITANSFSFEKSRELSYTCMTKLTLRLQYYQVKSFNGNTFGSYF